MAYDAHADHHDDHAHAPQSFFQRWFNSTNHKDIGTLYLWFAFTMLLSGGVLALMIRTELFQPGLQWFAPEFFNQMTTTHALVMIFGAVMPAFVGLANWMIPMMIGAPDMALPRMNNWSFWILPFAFTLLLMPLILLFCIVGTFAINNTVFDVGVMLIAGVVAYVLEENGFPSAPAILGVVLGGMLEENFISSMIKSDGNLVGFFSRPIAASLGVLTLSAWFLPPVIKRLRRLAGA